MKINRLTSFSLVFPALFFLFFFQKSTAQPFSILAKKSTVAPTLNRQHAERLDTEISFLLQKQAAGSPNFSVFALEPKLLLLDEGKIEGLQNRPTVKLDAVFRAVNLFSGESFGTFNLVLVGSGSTRDQAIEKALGTLRKQSAAFSKKLESVQENIKNYYRDHCPAVLAEAKKWADEQKLDDALALLHGIPADAPCFQESQVLKMEIFQKIQVRDCQNILHQSDSRAAANDFAGALQILARVDAAAPCFSETKSRVAALETQLDEAQKTQNEWLLKFFQTGADAEKARLNAISEICAGHLHGSARWNLNVH